MNEFPQIPQGEPHNNGSRGAYKEHLKVPFLEAFRKSGTIYEAAGAVGINRDTVNDWRKSDPKFEADYSTANIDLTERLESTAFSRAMERSDQLLIFLLKARCPDMYRGESQRESIDPKEISALVDRFVTGLRLHIPSVCPGCKCDLKFHHKVEEYLAFLAKNPSSHS